MSKLYRVTECELPVNPAINTPKVGDIIKWKLIGSTKLMMIRVKDGEIIFGMEVKDGLPFNGNGMTSIKGEFGERQLCIKLEEVTNECIVLHKTAQS